MTNVKKALCISNVKHCSNGANHASCEADHSPACDVNHASDEADHSPACDRKYALDEADHGSDEADHSTACDGKHALDEADHSSACDGKHASDVADHGSDGADYSPECDGKLERETLQTSSPENSFECHQYRKSPCSQTTSESIFSYSSYGVEQLQVVSIYILNIYEDPLEYFHERKVKTYLLFNKLNTMFCYMINKIINSTKQILAVISNNMVTVNEFRLDLFCLPIPKAVTFLSYLFKHAYCILSMCVSFVIDFPFATVHKSLQLTNAAFTFVNEIIVLRVPKYLCELSTPFYTNGNIFVTYIHDAFSKFWNFVQNIYKMPYYGSCEVPNVSVCLADLLGRYTPSLYVHTRLAYAFFPSLLYPVSSSVVHGVAILADTFESVTETNLNNFTSDNVYHFDSHLYCRYSINKTHSPIDLMTLIIQEITPDLSPIRVLSIIWTCACSFLSHLLMPDISRLHYSFLYHYNSSNLKLTFFNSSIDYYQKLFDVLMLLDVEVRILYLFNALTSVLPSIPELYPDVAYTMCVKFFCRSLDDVLYIFHPWPRIPVQSGAWLCTL